MAITVGVLLIDSIDEPHRSIAGDYDRLYTDLLTFDDVEVVLFDGAAELPDHGDCDGWVIPGSRCSVDDDEPWIPSLESWASEALDRSVPLAGVCFGHQLIARVTGAPVGRALSGWTIGAIDYEVCHRPAWIDGLPDRFRLLASHQDQVFELPAGASLFATAESCPIAGYTIDDTVLCVQGHPEFVPELAASLYRSRVGRIDQVAIDRAIETLDRPLDRDLVAGWLVASARRRAAQRDRIETTG